VKFRSSIHDLMSRQFGRRGSTGSETMKSKTIVATAAAVFAATTFVAASASAKVNCPGANACKGQSACKGATNACKGQNACKGKGFTETSTTVECTVIKSR
jgi:hypothetical protein